MENEDWKIGLLGGLDGTKSRSQLNSDIKGLARNLEKLKIYAELAPDQAKQLRQQMKTLQIELNNVTVSDAAINGLVTSINNKLKGIQIPSITIGGTGNNTLSRQLGDNTSKLNAFKDSLKNIGMADSDIDRVAKRIEGLGVQINSLGQSTLFKSGASGNRNFLNVEIDGIDKFGQAVKLTEQWDLELGTLVKSIDAVSTAQEKAGTKVDNFATRQKQAVSNLTNQINQLSRAANDPNAARPISETGHLTQLSDAYNDIISSIQKMGNASNATFADEQNNVRALISNYKSMVSEFRNAENVSTKMKGMDFASGLTIAKNDLEKFKAEAKDFPQILQTIQKLDTAITHVGDASSLNSFNDQLRVARSELAKFKSETNAANKNEKVGINISGLQSKISDLQKISPEINTFETEINGAKVTVQSLLTELGKVSTQSDFSVVNTKWRAFTEAAKASGIAVRLIGDNSESSAHKIQKIAESLDTGIYSAKVDSIVAKTQKWTDANGNAKISTTNLQSALNNLNTAYANITATGGNTEANQRALIEAEKQLGIQIQDVTNKVTTMNAKFATDKSVQSLLQKYQQFYDKNSAAHRRWGAQIKAGITELSSGMPVTIQRANQLEMELNQVGNAARQAGKLGKSWFDTMKSGMKSFSYWTSSTYLVMKAVQEVRQAVTSVRELDTALVDLTKTTTMTKSQLEQFYYTANDTAKQMGVTTKEIIDQASAWSRLGYSSAEAATKMAKYSSMFASISPGMDVDKATDGLVSIMKAFDIGNDNPDEVLDGIMSKINIIGNTAATSNDEIVAMLSKSSSAMREANNTLEETIALETAAVEITRDDDSVGTAFKTVAMRIRGYDEETESFSNNVEQLSGDIANLTKTASTPGGISLFTDASKTEYKSTYQLLKEISEIYDQLDDKTQAGLLEALAGKRQGQIIAATINNFEAAEKAMDDMANSAGSAEREMAIIMDSVDYKANKLKETGTGIAQNLFERDDMKTVIDTLTWFGEKLDWVTEKAGLFGTLAIGGGLFAGIKNIGICV